MTRSAGTSTLRRRTPRRRHAVSQSLRPRRAVRPLSVAFVHGADKLASPGGGEVQMLATGSALAETGVDVRFLSAGEVRPVEFDLIHLFGSLREYQPLVDAACAARVPVVLSTIAWFDFASRWHDGQALPRRLAGIAGLTLRHLLPGWPHWRGRLFQSCDRLLPNSRAEAAQLQLLWNVPDQQLCVIPNGADERLADSPPDAFREYLGLDDFVLYAGRLEPRKNQLRFLQAMRGSHLPIVILGDTVPGHEMYAAACHRAAGREVRFVPALAHDSPLLASALRACRCLVLASWFETPGLVALEAGLSGTPLVLTSRGATQEYFSDLARYVDPADHAALCREVERSWHAPRRPELAQHVRSRFTWRQTAQETRRVYEQLLTQRR